MLGNSASGGGQGDFTQFIFLGLVLVVFYFFMIRPQMKKTKEQKVFRESLKKGDKVITIGGLHGKIIEIDEDAQTIDLEVANNVRLKFEKSSISLENTKAIDSKKTA
jgi:preprotein translocase subunit YajC